MSIPFGWVEWFHCRFLLHHDLGEKKWLQEVDDGYWDETEDPDILERNISGESCGLKNLGATCYVNSLLQVIIMWSWLIHFPCPNKQVLFHNNHLRRAIYTWDPRHDQKETPSLKPASEDPNLGSFDPKSTVGLLQSVFAKLQFGYSRYADPSSLIKSLDLDVSQQQDAQEFCKLFLNLLEADLSNQPNPMVKNIVQSEYSGELDYVTKCLGCGNEFFSSSKFYELTLNIEGNQTVAECLNQFFSEEMMEGNNQYRCGHCQREQMATRGIRLKKLPPTLNLQLLRFVYDRNRNARKKLNNEITFPEVLSMKHFLAHDCQAAAAGTTYALSAVLVHVGNQAQSGHYVAHIKDQKTGIWYKFNDERVEKIAGNSLKQCLDDDQDIMAVDPVTQEVISNTRKKNSSGSKFSQSGDTNSSKDKSPGKSHSSRNAYMLVYQSTLRSNNENIDWKSLLPVSLKDKIGIERSRYLDWASRFKETQKFLCNMYKIRQKEIRDFYSQVTVREQNSCEFLPKSWISGWLKSTPEMTLPPVDNSSLLCPHNKLSLNKTSSFKCISSEAAKIIYDKYKIQPTRLSSKDLCVICVQRKVTSYQLKLSIQDDAKILTDIMKIPPKVGQSNYWLGNKSIKNWKQLAQAEAEDCEEEDVEMVDVASNSSSGISIIETLVWLLDDLAFLWPSNTKKTGSKSISGNLFNEEILCDHGSCYIFFWSLFLTAFCYRFRSFLTTRFFLVILCTQTGNLNLDTSCRKKVSGEVWSILRKYFPSCPEILSSSESCTECLATKAEEDHRKQLEIEKAHDEKSLLTDLFHNKRRPGIEDVAAGQKCFLVSPEFLKKWRQFLEWVFRDPIYVNDFSGSESPPRPDDSRRWDVGWAWWLQLGVTHFFFTLHVPHDMQIMMRESDWFFADRKFLFFLLPFYLSSFLNLESEILNICKDYII